MRTRRRAVSALVALGLVAACGGDDTGASPTAPAPSTAPGDNAFTPEPISWQDCGSVECATVEVPLDYAAPDGDRFSVYVSRIPAAGDRIGPLFVNPGGPGASGTQFAQGLAVVLPDAIAERFDIIAVEPRGVAGSGTVDCDMSSEELYGPDPTLEDEADRAALLDVSTRYVAGCVEHTGLDRLAHVGTRDVARDMDAVRAAMGDAQLSYLGVSYGTVIGQVYAQLFPSHVRAMTLDGVLELGPTGLQGARDQALGFELALQRWAAACRADEGCSVGDDPIGAVESVISRGERPGGIPSDDADRPAGPAEVNLGVGEALYTPALWGQLDTAIDAALGGDGTGIVQLADSYLGGSDYDVYFAVNCLDEEWPVGDPDALLAEAKAIGQAAPHFGEALATDYVRCALWPVPAQPLEADPLPGLPTILVISTTGDPATPFEAGVRLVESLDDAVLLTHDGDGHGAIANLNECVDDALAGYLVDLDPPPVGTVCAG
jgi:pimeloyl-ACP methyl ester carboxylesterase